MSQIIGAPIFFCHPCHSWKKGQVEKINQLIRLFIKKGSDISKASEEKVNWIQEILNNRPLTWSPSSASASDISARATHA